jgi:hypothetical protein
VCVNPGPSYHAGGKGGDSGLLHKFDTLNIFCGSPPLDKCIEMSLK